MHLVHTVLDLTVYIFHALGVNVTKHRVRLVPNRLSESGHTTTTKFRGAIEVLI